mgnify:CR=1 FL=1
MGLPQGNLFQPLLNPTPTRNALFEAGVGAGWSPILEALLGPLYVPPTIGTLPPGAEPGNPPLSGTDEERAKAGLPPYDPSGSPDIVPGSVTYASPGASAYPTDPLQPVIPYVPGGIQNYFNDGGGSLPVLPSDWQVGGFPAGQNNAMFYPSGEGLWTGAGLIPNQWGTYSPGNIQFPDVPGQVRPSPSPNQYAGVNYGAIPTGGTPNMQWDPSQGWVNPGNLPLLTPQESAAIAAKANKDQSTGTYSNTYLGGAW